MLKQIKGNAEICSKSFTLLADGSAGTSNETFCFLNLLLVADLARCAVHIAV